MSDEMEIIDRFITEIDSGQYKPDEKLPSENKLADYYRVPRITVRKAYERLQELGYIYSKQGKGSYIKDRHKQIQLVLSGDVSFSQKMKDMGYNFQSKNIFCEKIQYNKKIYDFLKISETDSVFKIGRLRYIDNRPIALHISHVAQSIFPDIEQSGINITSMFNYYNSKGYTQFYPSPSYLRVTFPTKFERDLFKCPHSIPFIVVESGCSDRATHKVLEYSKILYRGDCFTYIIS